MIKTLSISGFRGFGVPQVVKFAIPDQEREGSASQLLQGLIMRVKLLSLNRFVHSLGMTLPHFQKESVIKKLTAKLSCA